jgi:hypothetical protein
VRAIVVAGIAVSAACRALPPAPVVPFHASTAAEAPDEVTVSVVVGLVMQPLGGAGFGLAFRLEQQRTDRTALGGELTAGWVEADDDTFWMFAFRGYGQSTPRTHDWVALTYGAGFSVLTTGMVSLQLHGGGAVAYPNEYVVPYLSTGVAASLPIIDGAPFGHLTGEHRRGAWRADPARRVAGAVPFDWESRNLEPVPLKSEFYVYGSIGTAVPLGDTGNALSLDFGVAESLRDGAPFFGLSLADTQH